MDGNSNRGLRDNMNSETQRANDMLAAIQAQRDQAMNGLVAAQAEIMALRRQLAEKQNEQPIDSPTGE